MTRRLLSVSAIAVALALPCLGSAIAVTPVNATAGNDGRPYMIGWQFAVTAPITVNALAYCDASGAGLAEPHKVAIFDSNGTVLISATVQSGASVAFQDGFRLANVSYTLQPGTYIIGGQRLSDADAALVRAASVRSIPQVTYLQERELATSDFIVPSGTLDKNEAGDFGPSFTVANTTATQKDISSIVNSGSFQPAVASGSYLSIFGTNLSSVTRSWTLADFGGGNSLPTSLEGISVTINGTPAYVQYVSPGQLNVVVPDLIPASSGVPVVVKYAGQPDVSAWVQILTAAPAFFTWPTGNVDTGKYAVAQHADASRVGRVGLFPSQPSGFTTPARPGETIVIYGTGFGLTSPFASTSLVADKAYPLSNAATATFGNRVAAVTYAGLVASLSSVYQVNVTVPADLPDGDWPIVVSVAGNNSAAVLVTVAR